MVVSPAQDRRPRQRRRRGFSLLELVLNVIILSMIAAIAVPRVSRAAQAAQAKSLLLTITRVRNAIEHYYAEHGRYPGHDLAGQPAGAWFVKQMTEYSDAAGNVSQTLVYPYIYGPYLRAPFPTNPLNGLNSVRVIPTAGSAVAPNSSGWVAVLSTGHFTINSRAEELADLGVTVLDEPAMGV